MIASAIAYALASLLSVLGASAVLGAFFTEYSVDRAGNLMIAGTLLLALAWGCAYLGGI